MIKRSKQQANASETVIRSGSTCNLRSCSSSRKNVHMTKTANTTRYGPSCWSLRTFVFFLLVYLQPKVVNKQKRTNTHNKNHHNVNSITAYDASGRRASKHLRFSEALTLKTHAMHTEDMHQNESNATHTLSRKKHV